MSTPQPIVSEIENLISQKNYPCVAAIQSLRSGEFQVGVYEGFGTGAAAPNLARDLFKFKQEQARTGSIYLSFWAVFPDAADLTEEEFETAMWRELSAVDAVPDYQKAWDPKFSDDPKDKNFCFSFDGAAFFVVGVHQNSSRQARQFRYPAIIFNLYEQFEALDQKGQYAPMVKAIRARDQKFQGNLNPMVEKYAEKWEAIQFSGRANPADWQCPFTKALFSLGKLW